MCYLSELSFMASPMAVLHLPGRSRIEVERLSARPTAAALRFYKAHEIRRSDCARGTGVCVLAAHVGTRVIRDAAGKRRVRACQGDKQAEKKPHFTQGSRPPTPTLSFGFLGDRRVFL